MNYQQLLTQEIDGLIDWHKCLDGAKHEWLIGQVGKNFYPAPPQSSPLSRMRPHSEGSARSQSA